MRAVGSLILLAVTAAAVACSHGGTGVGTAPAPTGPCPTTVPKSGDDCSKLFATPKVCCCDGVSCNLDSSACSVVAFCPGGVGATWDVEQAGDAEPLADALADAAESGPDADASDASDADAADADAADVDAADVDAGETADGADASDALDSADAADAADVIDATDAVDAADAD
jgi:hypothetical protein